MGDIQRQISDVSTNMAEPGNGMGATPSTSEDPSVSRKATKVINILRAWDNEHSGRLDEKYVTMAVENVVKTAVLRDIKRWRVYAIFITLVAIGLLVGLVAVCVKGKGDTRYNHFMGPSQYLSQYDHRGMGPSPAQNYYMAGPTTMDPSTPSGIPAASPFVPVEALNEVPLETISMMDTLSLQLGTPDGGKQQEYRYTVDGVFRELPDAKTVILLGGGHRFTVTPTEGILTDQNDKLIKVLHFTEPPEGFPLVEEPAVEEEVEAETATSEELSAIKEEVDQPATGLFETPAKAQQNPTEASDIAKRRLGPKKQREGGLFSKPVNVDPHMPTSFFDAYCKYGCGGMAVTFPYYYRPFMGYGFPLVGTEAMFPAGYGGYAAAPLLASQGGTPPLAGMGGPVVAGGAQRPAPGYGARTVTGGVQPGALPGY